MKKTAVLSIAVVFSLAVVILSVHQISAQNTGTQAEDIVKASEERVNLLRSDASATQAVQVHTQATNRLLVIIAKQNDEIISLLQQIAKKK